MQPEFGAIKPTLPLGQVPILEVDGVVFNQSKAIENYVARKTGLYPADTELALYVDIVRETLTDLSGKVAPVLYGPEEGRAAAKAELVEKAAPTAFAFLEKQLAAKGGVWFTGVGVSIADIATFNLLDAITGIEPTILSGFPALAALKERVAAIPTIAAYLAKRP